MSDTSVIVVEQPPVSILYSGVTGVPAGGTEGQVLKKLSNTDYDTEWSSVLVGATRIEIVDVVPDPQVAGVLYLSKT